VLSTRVRSPYNGNSRLSTTGVRGMVQPEFEVGTTEVRGQFKANWYISLNIGLRIYQIINGQWYLQRNLRGAHGGVRRASIIDGC